MTISMYQASVPSFIRALTNLSAILAKAAAHAEARKIDPLVLTGTRLFPDMFPLSRQVQIATDMAKNGVARLAGVDAPKFEDTETSFAELEARVAKTIDYLKGFKTEQIDGSESKEIILKLPSGPTRFEGSAYLSGFVLPNLYFHIATAYNILRSSGVELGKADFLGKL